MLKKYTPPYVMILLTISVINIISSTYFIAFILAGVTFKIFTIAIKNEHNYLFILSVITFLVIENTQGLRLFSLTLISLILYFFIIPRIKHLFSSSIMLDFIYIFTFYFILYLVEQAYSVFDLSLLLLFVINFVIDILVIGFIL